MEERMNGMPPADMGKIMQKKEKKVNIIMAVVMSLVMGLFFAFLARHNAGAKELESMPPAPIMFITSALEAIIAGLIVALILPLGKAGRLVAGKFNAEPPSMKFTLINSIPLAVVNAVICSAVCSFISIARAYSNMPAEAKEGTTMMKLWFGNWIKTLPLSIIIGYVVAIIIAPIVVKSVGLGAPPAGRPPVGGPPVGGPPVGGPPSDRP